MRPLLMSVRLDNFPKVESEYNQVCLSNKQFRNLAPYMPKGANLRWVARVPLAAATVHPEVRKYIETTANSQDLKKEVDNLLKRFPEFDRRIKNNSIITVGGFLDRR